MSKRSPPGIAALVAVGCAHEQEHRAALRHGRAVALHRLRHVPAHVRRGRLEAQELLDRVGDERGVVDQLATLVGVLSEHLARPPDEARGRLVAGAGDDGDVGEDLLAPQRARRARLVDELGVHQLGHDVVGGVLDAPVEVLGEHLAVDEVLRHLLGLARLGAQPRVALVAHRLLVALGDAEQHADHAHRHLRAEVGDEVEPGFADERVEALRAVLADLRLERVDLPGREHAREQAPVDGVRRRVLEDEDAGRHLDARLDDLEDAAPSRDVGVPVDQRALDVVVAAQRVEVVLLVVVERRLLPEPGEHRVGVGVDPHVVRVVRQVTGLRGGGHRGSPGFVSEDTDTKSLRGEPRARRRGGWSRR